MPTWMITPILHQSKNCIKIITLYIANWKSCHCRIQDQMFQGKLNHNTWENNEYLSGPGAVAIPIFSFLLLIAHYCIDMTIFSFLLSFHKEPSCHYATYYHSLNPDGYHTTDTITLPRRDTGMPSKRQKSNPNFFTYLNHSMPHKWLHNRDLYIASLVYQFLNSTRVPIDHYLPRPNN